MAVRIRLKRIGAKKKAFYRVVVTDARKARDGKFIESLGYYDPAKEKDKLKIDEERALAWLNKGAEPSGIMASLLKHSGILKKSTLRLKVSSPKKEEVISPKKEGVKKKSSAGRNKGSSKSN